MPLEQDLNDLLKQAMRDKDTQTSNVVRMLKTKVMERRTAKGFSGTIDDALVLDVISAYKKQMQKAITEFGSAGAGAEERVAELKFEIDFCDRFLPKGLDEAALTALVHERIASLGLKSTKEMGRLLGDIMKTHKGLADAADIKRVAEARLPKA